MKLILWIYVFLMISLSFVVSNNENIWNSNIINNGCITTNEWIFRCNKEISIFVDNTKNDPIETKIDLSQLDFEDPKECETKFCYKESTIIIKVEKIYKPIDVIINSSSLKANDFADKFPNIVSQNYVNNLSPVVDRFVLQKVLYERWLLESKPTGKIWYITEQAIMKLQCIKKYQEFDKINGIFFAWPKTISEINKIKEKMKDKNYLKNTHVPNINLSTCWENFKKRNDSLNTLLWNPPSRANNSYSNTWVPSYSIQLNWEVKIQKK